MSKDIVYVLGAEPRVSEDSARGSNGQLATEGAAVPDGAAVGSGASTVSAEGSAASASRASWITSIVMIQPGKQSQTDSIQSTQSEEASPRWYRMTMRMLEMQVERVRH
jgi:hypothetical protein